MTTVASRPASYHQARAGRKTAALRALLIVAGVAPFLVALADTSELPATTRLLGLLLWFLSTVPALRYLSRRPVARRPLPFIETISFAYGLYYALPIALNEINRAWRITVDPHDGYDVPVQLALLGWMAMMAMYEVVTFLLARRKRPRELAWRPNVVARWASAFLIAGVIVNGLRELAGGNVAIGGVIQLFVSLQWLGIGLLVVLSRRGELNTMGHAVLYSCFAAAIVVGISHGNVLPIVMICIVVAFAMWAGKPAIGARWIVSGVLVLLVAVTLRGVIRDYRMTAWLGTQQFSQSERVELMLSLVTNRIRNEGVWATIAGGGQQTAQRSANMDMFADVIRRTPSEVPYWNGQTYYSLVGAMVPRFLWKDKPTKELGQAFGHRYRYLDPTNLSTAINLPILVEFYVNFGAAAVVIGMLIVGTLYGVLDSIVNRPGQSLMVTMIGLTLLLPLLLIESDFSLVFGGLPLSGLAMWGIYKLMSTQALRQSARESRARARATASMQRSAVNAANRPALPTG